MDERILEFADTHKTAQEAGLSGLYRFLSFSLDDEAIKKHEATLTHGLLYHTTRERLNDPHDLNFKINWPAIDDEARISGYIEDLKLSIALSGVTKFPEGLTVGDLLTDEQYRNRFESELKAHYTKTRICCFTTSKTNPLFWAHYAQSSTGYCLRFKVGDSDKSIFSNTRKIHYSNEYPTLEFPIISSNAVSTMRPILRKSMDWKYEDEYRSFFSPHWPFQLENNGDSLSLSNDEITDVYFGLNMGEAQKAKIVELVSKGPFNPTFWNSYQDGSDFQLKFEQY
jgi:hypothetical protein